MCVLQKDWFKLSQKIGLQCLKCLVVPGDHLVLLLTAGFPREAGVTLCLRVGWGGQGHSACLLVAEPTSRLSRVLTVMLQTQRCCPCFFSHCILGNKFLQECPMI
jgi:hypothetical protein